MKASGLLFLSGRPFICHRNSPTDGAVIDWVFPTFDRRGKGVQRVDVYWRGTAAAAFVQANAGALKAGQALALEIDTIRPAGDRLQARVLACELAPARWSAKPNDGATTAPQQPQQHHAAA